jgi:hypothetical protein
MGDPERRSPAQQAAGRARNCHSLAAYEHSEHTPPAPNLQEIRARWLVRHGVAPAFAWLIAELSFTSTGRRY